MTTHFRRTAGTAMSCLLSVFAPLALPGTAVAKPRIDVVFFAQTHVQKPDSPWFKLVANRDALIKAHVVSPEQEDAPPVSALLSLDGAATNLVLRGPATLPAAISTEPGKMEHRFDNSFTAMIPKEWIRRGLQVTVKTGNETMAFTNLCIGAPTIVNMTLLDVHFFEYDTKDYTQGWEKELEVKWPVARLNVQRIPRILFKELVIPPRAGRPAVRCASTNDYLAKAGLPFDGEQSAALQWQNALQHAGAQKRLSLFYVSIGSVYAGGQAGGFGGVGGLGRDGVLHHELGHALGRPHLNGEAAFPYRDTMYGIVGSGPHVGPTWGFDPRIGVPGAPPGMPYFIPPVVQTNSAGGKPGEWKHDPMQGGMDDREPGSILRMFSDYSMHRMQAYLEGHVIRWDEAQKGYVKWNDATGQYGKVAADEAASLPIEHDVDVFSVLVGVSAVTPEANIVYPPIGPYTSGLIKLWDSAVPEDRALAARQGACDVSLRVEQGGKIKTFLLPIAWEPGGDRLSRGSLKPRAVNLPARDGKVTRADLLLTPGAHTNGLPSAPKVLASWK